MFPGATAFAFWDDLAFRANTSENVYFGSSGTSPNREFVIEFYATRRRALREYFRFQVIFFENAPGIVQYRYFQAWDGGASATIGTQGKHTLKNRSHRSAIQSCTFVASPDGPVMQYSFNSAAIPLGSARTTSPTLILTFDTNTNSYIASSKN